MFLFYLIVIVFVLFYVFVDKFYKKKRHFDRLLKNVPTTDQIPYFPIIGHALHIKQFLGDAINIRNYIKFDSSPFKIWFFNNPIVFVFRPEDVHAILKSQKCLEKHFLYHSFRNCIGESLLAAPYKRWKKNRKIVNQAFHKSILDEFIPIYATKTSTLIDLIYNNNNEKMTDIYNQIFNCAVDIICSTAFNMDVDMQTNPNTQFINVINREREIIVTRTTNGFYATDFIYQFTALAREEKKLMTSMLDLYKSKFAERRKEAEKLCEEDLLSKKKLYDHLVDVQKKSCLFTDTEVMDEIRGFVVAGSETTALTVCFTLILLALNKHEEEKVYDEILNVIGTDRDVNAIDIPNLVYLDQVIKESLRLFPVASYIIRRALDDIKLEYCTIPRGCGIWVGLGAMMRSEKYYKDAYNFRPSRFSAEDAKYLYPNSFFPFSGGTRNCIGKNYAMDELKVMISMIIRKFTVETSFKSIDDITCEFSLMVNSIKGYPVKFISRNNNVA